MCVEESVRASDESAAELAQLGANRTARLVEVAHHVGVGLGRWLLGYGVETAKISPQSLGVPFTVGVS